MSDPPTDEELNVYRTQLDVRGQTMDRGVWVLLGEDGKYYRQGEQEESAE